MIFDIKNPGNKIKSVLSELGPDYEIKRVDLWNSIYRDLGNGYELIVNEIDNNEKGLDVSISVYQNKPQIKHIETIRKINSLENLKTALEELVVKYS